MAGKKETPRQKMIGMMYLVLTALLALNVSKEVIEAFVTINDKIDGSVEIVAIKSNDNYEQFQKKKVGLLAAKQSLAEFNTWYNKAQDVKKLTKNLVNYIMSESNHMIKTAEGEDWVAERDEIGHIKTLKPLIDIRNMDNYDIPTNIFVGTNPATPNKKGIELQTQIHLYRDSICALMGNIMHGDKKYSFVPPSSPNQLTAALTTVFPEDSVAIKQVYQSLTIPAELKSYSKDGGYLPWASVLFDHAPVVAAASLLNALKLDIKNSEVEVTDFLLRKIEAPIFVFNKIEPMPIAKQQYINAGDSLLINVMIAAFDSTANTVIKYGIDKDTIPENWTETKSKIAVSGDVGTHRIKGVIGVEERGNTKWKPWSFDYTVGKPLGVISQPEMRVLYKGYDNVIEGTASGFQPENIRISGSGCTVTRLGNHKYNIKPHNGTRTASLTISGIKEDGTNVNLGTFSYRVKPMPTTETYLGSIKNGDTPQQSTVNAQRQVQIRFGAEVLIKQVPFNIVSGSVMVEGLVKTGKVLPGGNLDRDAISILRQGRGKNSVIIVKYRDPSGITKTSSPLIFKAR